MAKSAEHFSSLGSVAGQFLSTNILQGGVAMRFRCGATFNYRVVRNLVLSLSVTEF